MIECLHAINYCTKLNARQERLYAAFQQLDAASRRLAWSTDSSFYDEHRLLVNMQDDLQLPITFNDLQRFFAESWQYSDILRMGPSKDETWSAMLSMFPDEAHCEEEEDSEEED